MTRMLYMNMFFVCLLFTGMDLCAVEDPIITPVGMSVVSNAVESAVNSNAFRAWKAGTHIAVLASLPREGQILSIEHKKCKLEFIQDDQGTNLAERQEQEHQGAEEKANHHDWHRYGIVSLSHRELHDSTSPKPLLFEISGPGIPALEASSVRCKGTVVFRRASKRHQQEIKNIKNVAGIDIKAEHFTFSVIASRNNGLLADEGEAQADGSQRVYLRTSDDMGNLMKITFLDADGKDLKGNRRSTSMSNNNGKTTYEAGYYFKERVETFTLRLESWTDVSEVEVPFYFKMHLVPRPLNSNMLDRASSALSEHLRL